MAPSRSHKILASEDPHSRKSREERKGRVKAQSKWFEIIDPSPPLIKQKQNNISPSTTPFKEVLKELKQLNGTNEHVFFPTNGREFKNAYKDS